jgi:radical SAM superfamily enzyme YgiQ (UPF0313 family)
MGGKKTRIYKEHPLIDYWVVGDGEASILKIVQGYRDKKILRFPYNDFEKFQMKWSQNDYVLEKEALPIEFSRGCPFKCLFCATKKRNLNEHLKPKEVIRKELIYNYENFGTTRYMIVDLTLNESPERTKDICDTFKSLPFKVEWTGVARLDIMSQNPWMADEMLEAGAKAVWFGMESLNADTLLRINKTNIHPDILKEYTYKLKEKWKDKVLFGSLFIIGLPLETLESVKKTFDWLISDDCPLDSASFHALMIRKPGYDDQIYSPLSNSMKEYGYIWHHDQWFNIHTGISNAKALEVAHGYTEKIIKKKGAQPIYFYYSRMKTLGYTDSELSTINLDFGESFDESEKRREILKKKYLKKLLQ